MPTVNSNLHPACRPLNMKLYRALQDRVGSVIIANEGCAQQIVWLADPLRPGESHAEVLVPGEYYRVCCPYCQDTRHRLWINHQFANIGPTYGPKRWLICCYNEHCFESFDRCKDLENRIFGFRTVTERRQGWHIRPGTVEPDNLPRAKFVGGAFKVDQLPVDHPAAVYLRDQRRHNLQYLAQQFRISYCIEALREHRMAQGRIAIPIYSDDVLVGWQARYIGDIDWRTAGIPKYYEYPGMSNRLTLYNIDQAKRYPFCVVVEGAMSVWRIGGPAVALFGKSFSQRQQLLMQEHWQGKPVFLMLDSDAQQEMEGILADMRREGRLNFISVPLPEGTDPDDFEHDAVVTMIQGIARQHGIDLPPW